MGSDVHPCHNTNALGTMETANQIILTGSIPENIGAGINLNQGLALALNGPLGQVDSLSVVEVLSDIHDCRINSPANWCNVLLPWLRAPYGNVSVFASRGGV